MFLLARTGLCLCVFFRCNTWGLALGLFVSLSCVTRGRDRRTSVWSEVIHLSSAQWVALRAGHAGNICSLLSCSCFKTVLQVLAFC